MKIFIAFALILISTYVFAEETTVSDWGPFDWNHFRTQVQNTLTRVDVRYQEIEKEMKNEPQKRANQLLEVEELLASIVEIQKMIEIEFKHINSLDTTQKAFVERSKNQALRLNQTLKDLRQKLQSSSAGVTAVYYDEETTAADWGPFSFQKFQKQIQSIISVIELRVSQLKVGTFSKVVKNMEIQLEINAIDEVQKHMENILSTQNLDAIQKAFIDSTKTVALKLKNELNNLKNN